MLWALLGQEHDCFPLGNPPTLFLVKDVNGDQPPDRQQHLVTKIISAPTAGPEADRVFFMFSGAKQSSVFSRIEE